jgi:hypothetical protein
VCRIFPGCMRRRREGRGWRQGSALNPRTNPTAPSTAHTTRVSTYRVSWKEGPVVDHLHKNAADGPDIHGGGVGLGAKEDLRGAVP